MEEAPDDTIRYRTCPYVAVYNRKRRYSLTFARTRENHWAASLELCLDKNNKPVKRFCKKHGIWSHINKACSKYSNETKTTETLHQLSNKPSAEAVDEVKQILRDNKNDIRPIDIDLISTILEKATTDKTINKTSFLESVDDLTQINQESLQLSQTNLNSTDKILDSLDKFLLNNQEIEDTKLTNLYIRSVDLSEKIRGLMFLNNFQNLEVVILENDYKHQLEVADFELAFVIPNNVTTNYFATIFSNNHLFIEPETFNSTFLIKNWILSIVTPYKFNGLVEIYFKVLESKSSKSCNYWNYGYVNNTSIEGQWKINTFSTIFKENVYLCSFNHTTHFGILISDSNSSDFVLDFLTIFGSILSLLGIAVIFLTAILFKSWINNASNKILLNLSICLCLLIILFFISDLTPAGKICIGVGIALQYMVTAQFCWTLTISYSMYRRLFLGLHYQESNVILKYCTFSWGAPIVGVIIVGALNINTYNKTDAAKFCYPKDNYFLFGILIPTSLILTANIATFVLIMIKLVSVSYEVNNQVPLRKHKRYPSCASQKSFILMIFMMGLTWIFGICSAIFPKISIFAYIFCTTATFHGLVIFVFYVLDNPTTRDLWRSKIRKICHISKKSQESTTDKTSSFELS